MKMSAEVSVGMEGHVTQQYPLSHLRECHVSMAAWSSVLVVK